MSIADVLANTIKEQDKIASSYATVGDVTYILSIFREKLKLKHAGIYITSKFLGDSFVVGHQTYGKVGIITPQPYIGNRKGTTTVLVDTRT